MLMPFWGFIKSDNEPHRNRFDGWVDVGKTIFEMVDSVDRADVVVYPQDPTIDSRGFQEFQQITAPKTFFVFFNSDSEESLIVRDNTIIFRTSVARSKKKAYEFGLPGWSEDWGYLGDRPYSVLPTVGFCGQDYRPKVRPMALNILQRSNQVQTNFIRKKQFWGGWITQGRKKDLGESLRAEFIGNLKHCDYGFCARGGGNFSYRLYETMMSGRIPILIDTDCLLPYDFIMNWGEYFPIVKETEFNLLPEKLINFHKKFSTQQQFNDHQHLMRELWKIYFSPIGFFSNIHMHLREC